MNTQRHVLVVDDDPSIQTVLVRLLQRQGFAARGAASIAGATATAESGPVDAVILDLGLSGGDESGLDFLRWLRGRPHFLHTPVLILTGQAHLSQADEALIKGEHAHVFYKPQPFAPLIDVIRRLIAEPQPG